MARIIKGFGNSPTAMFSLKARIASPWSTSDTTTRITARPSRRSSGLRLGNPHPSVLGEAGVRPEDVTHVFLTHLHFDHAGNTDAFPNAIFYVQERELSKAVWAMALDRRFRWLNSGTDPGDVLRVVDLARQGRLVSVDGDREDVLPGIDLRAAFDTHTWGCQFVTVRNDGKRDSQDSWVMAGDLAYTYENLRGMDPTDPQYIPVGLAMESQCNLLFATDAMVNAGGGDYKRVVPVHEEALKEEFPSRILKNGLRISEIALADGERSLVN